MGRVLDRADRFPALLGCARGVEDQHPAQRPQRCPQRRAGGFARQCSGPPDRGCLHARILFPPSSEDESFTTDFEFLRWDDGRVLSRTPLGDAVEAAYGAPFVQAGFALGMIAMWLTATLAG